MKITNQLLLICAIVLVVGGLGSVAQARYACSGGDCAYVTCDTNSDCGNNQFTGTQFCAGNSISQNYITFICNNPGTGNSSCTYTSAPRVQYNCSSNGSCISGSCQQNTSNTYTGYTPTYTTTTYVAQSYRRCVGNTVYWHDTNGNPQNVYQVCSNNQTCSNGECTGTNVIVSNYVFHSMLGCVNNKSYWYDSTGNQQGLYQNCSLTSQVCQSGQCVGNPQLTSVQKTAVTTEVTKTETQNSLTASVSANGSLLSFVKKWYIWLIIIIILIVLFIIVFRRLSSGS